ncbi:MAG: S26 family signal peptidase, partial [Planctomycetota bacterium]|nr:S26 family signal peptidase [Planctomycetota bacterium]
MGKTEGRKETHEGGGESGDPTGSLHGGSEEQRGRIERERKSTALVLLVLMIIVPALALYKGVGESDIRFLVSGGILLPLVALTCALYWIGYRWAYTLAVYSAGVGLFCTFLYTVREGGGSAFLFLVPFVIAEYILYRTRQKSVKPKEEKTENTQMAIGLWLKENIEAIVIAFVMALVIRCFFIEVFKIPSSSMEPTLLGDYPTRTHPDCDFQHNHGQWPEGDRIMVMKYNYLFEDVQRYDVMVFKFPLELSRNFIKRVVGLPDEEGFIFGGNWFIRSTKEEEPRFQFARKPVSTQKEIWIEPASSGHWFANRNIFLEDWRAPAETPFDILDGNLKTYGKNTRFVLKEALRDTDQHPVGDVMIAFEITPTSGATTQAEIKNELGTFTLTLGPDKSILSFQGGDSKEKTLSLDQATIPPGKTTRILFSVYDGQAILFVEDHPFAPLTAQTWYQSD